MDAISNEPLLDGFEHHLRQQGYERKTIPLNFSRFVAP